MYDWTRKHTACVGPEPVLSTMFVQSTCPRWVVVPPERIRRQGGHLDCWQRSELSRGDPRCLILHRPDIKINEYGLVQVDQQEKQLAIAHTRLRLIGVVRSRRVCESMWEPPVLGKRTQQVLGPFSTMVRYTRKHAPRHRDLFWVPRTERDEQRHVFAMQLKRPRSVQMRHVTMVCIRTRGRWLPEFFFLHLEHRMIHLHRVFHDNRCHRGRCVPV